MHYVLNKSDKRVSKIYFGWIIHLKFNNKYKKISHDLHYCKTACVFDLDKAPCDCKEYWGILLIIAQSEIITNHLISLA